MTIELNDTIRAIYFLSGDKSDWMAAVNQSPDGIVTCTYRFRYYDPADPDNDSWSGKDKKNWYATAGAAPGEPSLDEALAAMQRVMDGMQAAGFVPKNGIACKLVRGSMTVEQFYREFKKLPFVHAKEVQP